MYTTLAWIPAAFFVFVNHRSPLQDRRIIYDNNSWLLCFSKHKNNNSKKKFFLSIPHLFLFLFCPSCSIYLISLLSSFSISPRSFLSLSVISPHPCARSSLSLLVAHSAPSLFSFPSIPVLSLLIPTSKSRHHFSCTFSPQVLRNFLSYSLLCLDSLIFSLLSFLSVSLPLSLSSAFIHFPFVLNLSTPSLT
jgi:hypothetical protein